MYIKKGMIVKMKNKKSNTKKTERLEKIDTKKFILLCIAIFLIIILCFLLYYFISTSMRKNNYENSLLSFAEKNENTIFSTSK